MPRGVQPEHAERVGVDRADQRLAARSAIARAEAHQAFPQLSCRATAPDQHGAGRRGGAAGPAALRTAARAAPVGRGPASGRLPRGQPAGRRPGGHRDPARGGHPAGRRPRVHRDADRELADHDRRQGGHPDRGERPRGDLDVVRDAGRAHRRRRHRGAALHGEVGYGPVVDGARSGDAGAQVLAVDPARSPGPPTGSPATPTSRSPTSSPGSPGRPVDGRLPAVASGLPAGRPTCGSAAGRCRWTSWRPRTCSRDGGPPTRWCSCRRRGSRTSAAPTGCPSCGRTGSRARRSRRWSGPGAGHR